MVRVYPANGAKLERLTVIEHEIEFGSERWADGSELTKEELDRLRKFHFVIEDENSDAFQETFLEVQDEEKPKRRRSKTE